MKNRVKRLERKLGTKTRLPLILELEDGEYKGWSNEQRYTIKQVEGLEKKHDIIEIQWGL